MSLILSWCFGSAVANTLAATRYTADGVPAMLVVQMAAKVHSICAVQHVVVQSRDGVRSDAV
jgi:hypothetical protein